MHEPLDRAAMIEAASRSLRQQLHAGNVRDRPRSKGSLHDGKDSALHGLASWQEQSVPVEEMRSEHAQRRIRSADNQHRTTVAASRDALAADALVSPSSALDNYEYDVDVDNHALVPGDEDAPIWTQDFRPDNEIKRPLSRKKDPPSSAAAGLGAFSGPARMTDAFEQRKTRRPIPVESWGPRPPSRAGMPQKASAADCLADAFVGAPSRGSGAGLGISRTSSKVGGAMGEQDKGSRSSSLVTSKQSRGSNKAGSKQMLGAKVGRGTWAAARPDPRDLSGGLNLGVFGCGTRAPAQQLTKSLSGVFDSHAAMGSRVSDSRPVSSADAVGDLEVSGYGLEHEHGSTAMGWPGSPAQSCGTSPPVRHRGRQSSMSRTEPMQMEDVEADPDLSLHANSWRPSDAAPVIVTRSQSHVHVRRDRAEQRAPRDRGAPGRQAAERERSMPFSTSLDVDFLNLFAS
eukprot:TRINITY_DN44811_c0_g1_i1.p1 TRINITY_DN44811_c0_g1~~TRINITY_DN44811_c0_g1_i1.p1  ORF type:complete len:458 (+),score=62.72 TRINITY_DN44811_c0_g1_i1:220-1593(+)